MGSVIDPTKPESGVPALKADLRANLQAAKTELDHGGFSPNTPTNYTRTPNDDKTASHLAGIDLALASSGGGASIAAGTLAGRGSASGAGVYQQIALGGGLSMSGQTLSASSSGGLTGWTDVKANHGAVGDGVADDTAEIQAALSSGATTIFFPVGTYKVSAQMTVSPGKRLVGSGIGRSIIDGRTADNPDGSAVLNCTASQTNLPNPNAAMVESNPSISFASSIDASLKLGDWIRVVDETTNSMTHNNEKDGFYCMVCSAEGTLMYPYGGVRRSLPASRSGAILANMRAYKLDQRGLWISDLEIWASGFDLDSTSNTSDNGHVVVIQNVANIFISNSKIVGGANDGLQVRNCCNVYLNNSVFGNHAGTWNGGGAYGIHIRGTGHLYSNNCTYLSQRHALEVDNSNMASHDVVVYGGMVACPQEQDFQQPATGFYTALDTHSGCYNLIFRDILIYGGCDLRSGSTKLLGCTIHGTKDAANDGAVLIRDLTYYDIEIRGNTLITYLDRFQGGAAITLFASAIDAGKDSCFIIADNVIKQIGTHTAGLIYLRGSSTGGADTGVFIITGNIVLNAPSGQAFLDVNVASGIQLVVRNNVFPAAMVIGSHTGFALSHVGDNVDGGTLVGTD